MEAKIFKAYYLKMYEGFEMRVYRRIIVKISWTDRIVNVEILYKDKEILLNTVIYKQQYLGHILQENKDLTDALAINQQL